MNLGVQYYRAPFPDSKYWEDDMRRIREAGLDTVQLWILWGWVEAKPGRFVFDDYDRLVELAGKNGLKVVLSTIAEIQPLWIHREVPGSEMITNLGHKVISSSRGECHYGMAPGGCTDHPGVWARMRAFLEAVGSRYASVPYLAGWDSWNELRWNINSDGEVCYCSHTVQAFRNWLDQRYGGLDGLNAAWKRRYGQWDEVMPGKMPCRPFTEWMAWSHFLTWKACAHGQARYAVLKAIDPKHPVTLHGGAPSPNCAGGIGAYGGVTPLAFGNDWNFADVLDGIGCSNFPKWFGVDDAEFGMNIEFIRSAARGKHLWLSELQGGRSASTAGVQESVDALSQQRWLWNGLACGADTILFWCWRDEVFGCESAGFGLTGRDGLAEERLAAMRVTGGVLRDHGALLDQYRPVSGAVGVLFSPQSYYGCGAQNGGAEKAKEALLGVARAFVRRSIPYTVVEDEHLEGLQGLRFVYLPAATTLSEKAKASLLAFAREGGVLAVESECGAFTDAGLYVEPPDRFLTQAIGLCEVGRRRLAGDSMEIELDGRKTAMKVLQWMTPLVGGEGIEVHAANAEGMLLATAPLGKGKVIYCASYPAEAYHRSYNAGFEDYIEWIAKAAGWQPDIEVVAPAPTENTFLYVKHGSAAGRRMVFVFFHADHKEARLRFRPGFFKARTLVDLITNDTHRLTGDAAKPAELVLPNPAWRFAVLAEGESSLTPET
jgi:beta-galactosidase